MKDRRDFLKAAAATLLAATTLPGSAEAQSMAEDIGYCHGLLWNRELPGMLGELLLTLDVRVNYDTGGGFGTVSDSIHPEFNAQFQVESSDLHGAVLVVEGTIIRAGAAALVGLPVLWEGRARTTFMDMELGIGDNTFFGSGMGYKKIIILPEL